MDSKAPFIIQISKGARSYTDKRLLEAMIRAADEIFPDAIFAVHLDHGDEATCMDCIDSGFYSSVMIDASHESFDEEHRHHQARRGRRPRQGHRGRSRTGQARRRRGACLRRRSRRQADRSRNRPRSSSKRSGCDSLACAIGTSHGAYKFSGSQGLHFDVIEEIAKRCRLPARHARIQLGAAGRGRAHQRRRRQAEGRQGRG
jgi:fructose-bisphosphate aldolase, class II